MQSTVHQSETSFANRQLPVIDSSAHLPFDKFTFGSQRFPGVRARSLAEVFGPYTSDAKCFEERQAYSLIGWQATRHMKLPPTDFLWYFLKMQEKTQNILDTAAAFFGRVLCINLIFMISNHENCLTYRRTG